MELKLHPEGQALWGWTIGPTGWSVGQQTNHPQRCPPLGVVDHHQLQVVDDDQPRGDPLDPPGGLTRPPLQAKGLVRPPSGAKAPSSIAKAIDTKGSFP